MSDWKPNCSAFFKACVFLIGSTKLTIVSKASDVGLFYRKSESIVGYLISKYGVEKIGVLIKYLKTQGDFGSNFF